MKNMGYWKKCLAGTDLPCLTIPLNIRSLLLGAASLLCVVLHILCVMCTSSVGMAVASRGDSPHMASTVSSVMNSMTAAGVSAG